MLARDVMTSQVEVIDPKASLEEAGRKMRQLDVGVLPICDGDELVGMLTDRDIAIRGVAEGMGPDACVADVMTEWVVHCFDDQPVDEVADMMREYRVRRIAVLNREKDIVGMISLGDVVGATGDHAMAGEVLEDVTAH